VGAPFRSSHPAKEPTVGSPAQPWSFPRTAHEEGEEICTCRRPATTCARGGRRRHAPEAAGDDPPVAAFASAPDLLAASAVPDLLAHGVDGDLPGAHLWGPAEIRPRPHPWEPVATSPTAAPLGASGRQRASPGRNHGARRTRPAAASCDGDARLAMDPAVVPMRERRGREGGDRDGGERERQGGRLELKIRI
jgi:hypothetical protein